MRKISYNELMFFIMSEFSEKDYYGIKDVYSDSLFSLKEYLQEIVDEKKSYLDKIKEPLSEVKSKNPWITMVAPMDFNVLNVYDENRLFFVLGKDNFKNEFESCDAIILNIKDRFKFLSRRKFVDNSKDELLEINKIAWDLVRKMQEETTISDIFTIENYFDYSIVNFCGKGVCRIQTSGNDFFVPVPCEFVREDTREDVSLSKEEAQMFINKLLLTR